MFKKILVAYDGSNPAGQAFDLALDYELVIGHPAERIVIHAEEWGADLIVVGHRGHGLMGSWLLGSVAKQVMHHATCAVLVAR